MSVAAGEQDTADASAVRALDPYAYQPGVGSAVKGLAAGGTGHDPNYVFHTAYVSAGRGHATVDIRFTGLTARQGTLMVRIHLLRYKGDTPQLVLVTSERTTFNRLVQAGGAMAITWEAFGNCQYAIYGTVLGETDAEAASLEVMLHPGQLSEEEGYHAAAHNSDHGADTTRDIPLLLSTDEPQMGGPVSQVATLPQLRSAHAGAILGGVTLPAQASALDQWALAYTIRCLQVYGMLGGSARGLALCAPDDPLVALVRRDGTRLDCLYDPERGAVVRPGPNVVNYDFLCWSEKRLSYPSKQDWMEEIQQSMKALLPGGLGVFMFGYDPAHLSTRSPSDGAVDIVNRGDMERLALLFVSLNHQVAQLRIVGDYEPLWASDTDNSTMVGFVVRRARLAE